MKLKKELQEKLASLDTAVCNLRDRAEQHTEETEQELKEKLAEARGECNQLAEKLRLQAAEKKSKAYADVLKTQMSYHQRKEELGERISEKKYQTEKAAEKDAVLNAIDYAEFQMDFAHYAMQEASVAVLEATQKQLAYEQKYGETLE